MASRRQKAASRGLGREGDRIVSGAVGKVGGGGEEESSTERADPELVGRAHPALCTWPLFSRPSCQAATGGEETSCPVCSQLSGGFWFSLSLLGFCFVLFRFVFFF